MHEKYNSLKQYILWMNRVNSYHIGDPLYEYPVRSVDTAKDIYKNLNADISPEQLHEDGEIPKEEAYQKLKAIRKIANHLYKTGFSIPFDNFELRAEIDYQ